MLSCYLEQENKRKNDLINRQAAINNFYKYPNIKWTTLDVLTKIKELPSAQPEYEPVTAEDFAKIMSENTIYGFITWHGKALELMERQGFVICKKTR